MQQHSSARSRAVPFVRWFAVVASAAVIGSLVSLPAAHTASAAAEGGEGPGGSAVTVKWAGGNDPSIQQYQPDHRALADANGEDKGSGHWDDFQNLEVTVSQTRGLIDQAVVVSAKGMAPLSRPFASGASNYLQVMQCHGDPASPDFAKTCQWGGYSTTEVGGRVGPDSPAGTTLARDGLRFRTVDERENQDQPGFDGAAPNRGLAAFFTGSTSNEASFVPFSAQGTASVAFLTQSAASQPYLGCGDRSLDRERCWLVIVPRGTHSGAIGDDTLCTGRSTVGGNTFGAKMASQRSSPLSPSCTYWANRIVVPLDFADPYLSCPPGSAERRVIGSELAAEAMSSWQPSLCADGGATYSLTTNSGDLARAQLLEGLAGMAMVSAPVGPDSIGTADPSLLDGSDVVYGPLLNSAVTIGFVLEGIDGTVYTDLKLTPRLLAKLLTQSFAHDVPQTQDGKAEGTVGDSIKFLAKATVLNDEEWQALGNPTNLTESVTRASWVVFGPQGDDAIRVLWEYVLSDADAVAFLRGDPDPWGNTVNRYYLPPEHPSAAGGGLELLDKPIDTLPKADQSLAPDKATADRDRRGLQLDSTSYSPYSSSFAANAARIARADRRLTFFWDPNIVVGVSDRGNWLVETPSLAGSVVGRIAMGPVTATDAARYAVTAAQLALPSSTRTTKDDVASRQFVPYDEQTVSRTLALQTVGADGFGDVDMTSLPADAYPLATTVYGAANLPTLATDEQARADYAALVDYAVSEGNVRSGQRGGLPDGYVPLTPAQIDAARDFSRTIREARVDSEAPDGDESASPAGVSSGASAEAPPAGDAAPATDTQTTPTVDAAGELTPAASSASAAIGGSLLAGIAGVAAAPFLLRRRTGASR